MAETDPYRRLAADLLASVLLGSQQPHDREITITRVASWLRDHASQIAHLNTPSYTKES